MRTVRGHPTVVPRAAGKAMDSRARLESRSARPRRLGSLISFILFKAGWFVCVLGAARGETAPALAWAALAYGAALLLGGRPTRVAVMVPLCALVGLAADGVLVASGAVAFPLDPPAVLGMPLWIVGIWVLFATTFAGCLAWLVERPMLAFLGGAVGSPLSFAAAESFGALELADGWLRLLLVSLVWGLLLPIQFALVRRLAVWDDASRASPGSSAAAP